MKSLSYLGALAALAFTAGAAFAVPPPPPGLTIDQVYAQLGGTTCVGSVCTFKGVNHGVAVSLPDGSGHGPSPSLCNGKIGFWSNPTPGICNIAISDDFNHGRDSYDNRTCSVKSAVLAHDPRAPFGVGWSLTFSTVTRTGSC